MPYLQTKDKTAIYYYDWGAGAPVVLIHGWPLTSASWEAQARVLADNGYRVIAYDRRGFGRSDWAGSGYDYNTLASDLNDLMQALDLQGATLVGFSMGGGEVARYFSEYGWERLHSVVLASAVPPYLNQTPDNPDGPLTATEGAKMTASLSADQDSFYDVRGRLLLGEWRSDGNRTAAPGGPSHVQAGRQESRTRLHGRLRQHRLSR